MNKVTIIIPSYNQQEFLPMAIESALSQTEKCDVVVIDDGSTDNSLAIAAGYQSKGIRLVAQVNKGLPSARNTGIMNTYTEFVLPLDADDILLDNCVEKLLKRQKEENSDITSPSFKNFGLINQEVVLLPKPVLKHFCVGNFIPYFSLFRTQVLREVGGYSPRMLFGYEDYHLTFNLLSRGAKLATTPEVLVLYRTKPNSMLTVAQQNHVPLMRQIQGDFPMAWQPEQPQT